MATQFITNYHFKDYDALRWAEDWVRDELSNKGPDELEDQIDAEIQIWFKPEGVKEAMPRPKFESMVTEAMAIPPSDSNAWSAWAAEQGAVMEPMSRPDFDAWVEKLRAQGVIFSPKDAPTAADGAKKKGPEAGPVTFTIQRANIRDSADNVFQVHNGKNRVWCLTEVDNIDFEFTGQTPTAPGVSGTAVASMTAAGIDVSIQFNSKFEEAQALEKLVKERLERMLQKLLDVAIGRWSYIVNENVNKGKRRSEGPEPTPETDKATSTARKPAGGSAAQAGANKPLSNTTTLTDMVEVMADMEQLFRTFTDPQEFSRITCRPCKFEGPMPGAKFELLDGAIVGEFVEAERPRRIIQKWRHKDWPSGHFSCLKLEFKEGDNKSSLQMEWSGVPADRADAMMQNWKGFYVESIQRFYGRLLF